MSSYSVQNETRLYSLKLLAASGCWLSSARIASSKSPDASMVSISLLTYCYWALYFLLRWLRYSYKLVKRCLSGCPGWHKSYPFHTETCNLACKYVLITLDRTPKTSSVRPIYGSRSPIEKVGVNRHFKQLGVMVTAHGMLCLLFQNV